MVQKNLPQKKTLGGGSREVVNPIAKAKLYDGR